MDRRNFIKQTGLAAAGVTLLDFPVFGNKAPSNKIVVGVMGTNSRGAYLADCFSKLPNVEVGYICDVEDNAIANGLKPFINATKKPVVFKDIRKLVEQKDMDALIIAAPDHWHAPATVLAAANGKHVYVEKPCGHNPAEGELLISTMNKTGKLIQMGNQRRSFPLLIEAVQKVRNGIIGKPYFAKAWYANNRGSIGRGRKTEVPASLDWNLWQGPAPRKDFQDNIVHYNWHWFWHWGTAETCNNGTHEIDCCRWFLDAGYPTKVVSSGGRYAYNDDWEMPDTQVVSFEFANNLSISWEGRSCNFFPVEGSSRGFIIYGTGGTLINYGADSYKIYDKANKLIDEVNAGSEDKGSVNLVSSTGNLDFYHFQNFADAIREKATLTSPIEEGHKSVLLCHLANIAQRTSGVLHCNPLNGHILDNAVAQKLWSREYEKGWEFTV